ncbi:MAG TPA: type II toxin-antitoxin system HicB family antitoxin [Rhizomicrobium sp.]
MQRFYTAIIEKASDGYGVFFPDLPGCTSFGRSVEEAAGNAYTAAQAHVALSQEYGDKFPEARPTDEIPQDCDVREKVRLLIPVEVAEEPVRRSGAIAHPARATQSVPMRGSKKVMHAGRQGKRSALRK